MSNQKKEEYEGMFAPKPDKKWTDMFGRTHEVHKKALEPDVRIMRNLFGEVVEIKQENW